MPIRISVITATLNRRKLLRRAIESVIAQGLENVEHIVIDGASTDGTLEILADYPHLTVVSEPDRCLYEAWNKGLRIASGDLFCILNSDDEIPIGAFRHARAALHAHPDLEMISGGVEVVCTDVDGTVEKRVIDDMRILSLREQDVGPGVPITNGRYMTPRLVERIGSFDERYRLVSDRDYLLRVLLSNVRNVTLSAPLYRYHVHNDSLTLNAIGANRSLSVESLAAARNGVREGKSTAIRAAYARWHAWAAFYLAGIEARERRFKIAGSVILEAFRLDGAWPLRIPLPLLRHVIERSARRGRRVGT